MPLRDALIDIENNCNNPNRVELPSPFDVLIDLARRAPDWKTNDLYKGHSWAFDAISFLVGKPNHIQHAIISILTDAMTKSGWDLSSALTAMWQRETIGSLQDISSMPRLSFASDVINEVANLSQACGVDLPGGFLDDLEGFREKTILQLTESVPAPRSMVGSDSPDENESLRVHDPRSMVVDDSSDDNESLQNITRYAASFIGFSS